MKIICFGDSNTFGYDPRGYFGGRYDKPWTQHLSEKSGWIIVNQGENGREIPCFPVDFPKGANLVIIMLGTNDLLQEKTVETIAKRMEAFLLSFDREKTSILLIAPPPMKLGEWVPTEKLIEDAKELTIAYQELAQRLGVRFVNAGDWNIPLAFDGVHFTESGHRAFAEGLYQYLTKEGA